MDKVHSGPVGGYLPREAMRLARDLEQGHYAMADAVSMIRTLALALDTYRRAERRQARAA